MSMHKYYLLLTRFSPICVSQQQLVVVLDVDAAVDVVVVDVVPVEVARTTKRNGKQISNQLCIDINVVQSPDLAFNDS
jgi:hypothetical protein